MDAGAERGAPAARGAPSAHTALQAELGAEEKGAIQACHCLLVLASGQ